MACRTVGQKRGLIRIVRTPSGEVELDIKGKKAGRGAYLCASRQCWEAGLEGGKVERALKVILSQERKKELMKLGEEIFMEKKGG